MADIFSNERRFVNSKIQQGTAQRDNWREILNGNHISSSSFFPKAWSHEATMNCELPLYSILVINFPFWLSNFQWFFYLPVRAMIIILIIGRWSWLETSFHPHCRDISQLIKCGPQHFLMIIFNVINGEFIPSLINNGTE